MGRVVPATSDFVEIEIDMLSVYIRCFATSQSIPSTMTDLAAGAAVERVCQSRRLPPLKPSHQPFSHEMILRS